MIVNFEDWDTAYKENADDIVGMVLKDNTHEYRTLWQRDQIPKVNPWPNPVVEISNFV